MLRRKSCEGANWVDFRKIREIELGIAKPPTKAELLIRTYSNGDSNSGGESSGTDWTVSEEMSIGSKSNASRGTDSGMNSGYSTLERPNKERLSRSTVRIKGKPIARRSLLHSFERPARDIDKFVSEALGLKTSPTQNDDFRSCDSGLELDYASLPRKIKNIIIDSDDSSTSASSGQDIHLEIKKKGSKTEKGSRSKSRTKKEKRAHFADMTHGYDVTRKDEGYHGLSGNQIQPLGTRIRSTSLDRNRLGTRSMSIFSMADSDCRSSDGISSEIFHSDMNEYRGNLAVGVRPKPKLRMSNYRGLMSRHDDLMKNFNRRQRETIHRVEYVFEKSNRQIETALIDMKIEMACKRH